jgi:hypothetical protein
MMMKKMILPLCVMAAGMGMASAHLVKINAPVSGTTLNVGTETTISWDVMFTHIHKYDFSFSKDGGKTWTKFASNVTVADQAGKTATFKWIPDGATTEGRIRICQKGKSTTEECNDNTPSQVSEPYMLQSTGNFTVQGASGVARNARAARTDLRFNADTRNLEVTLDLPAAERVVLEAFDARGELVATLFDGTQEAGSRGFSVFSNRLQTGMPLVFKLRAGNDVQVRAWDGLR